MCRPTGSNSRKQSRPLNNTAKNQIKDYSPQAGAERVCGDFLSIVAIEAVLFRGIEYGIGTEGQQMLIGFGEL